jgi:hypothetical protein
MLITRTLRSSCSFLPTDDGFKAAIDHINVDY